MTTAAEGAGDDLVEELRSALDAVASLCESPSDRDVVQAAQARFDGDLYDRVRRGQMSPEATRALARLAQALAARNKAGVTQANIALITDSWIEVKALLPNIKALVELCKKIFP